ncbi:hypothetical protein [Pedosphaera parvula]|uniref:Uncharacterized protein n=1 Tax=Pedosphaera parvula (strain Ellin514) TaxID=320771 RepID=B9XLN9_PEDPL|nr:hypothetical protein [Pedosphaera parvula]EEF59287.1 hypothetical protein Cflav_PD2138 [Pedosphaera parvula Ellin514]
MNEVRGRKIFSGTFWILLLTLCGGCSAFWKRDRQMVDFIKPGITTKAEVLENLGQPLWVEEGGLAYLWNPSWGAYPHRRASSRSNYKRSTQSGSQHEGRHNVDREYAVFCVAFDSRDHVSESEFLQVGDGSADDEVAAWFHKSP